jgi:hypothetical protein
MVFRKSPMRRSTSGAGTKPPGADVQPGRIHRLSDAFPRDSESRPFHAQSGKGFAMSNAGIEATHGHADPWGR